MNEDIHPPKIPAPIFMKKFCERLDFILSFTKKFRLSLGKKRMMPRKFPFQRAATPSDLVTVLRQSRKPVYGLERLPLRSSSLVVWIRVLASSRGLMAEIASTRESVDEGLYIF